MTSAGSIAIIVARVLWGFLFFVGLHPAIVHISSIILDGLGSESDAINSLGNYQFIDKIIDGVYEIILGLFLLSPKILNKLWYARYILPFIVIRLIGIITFLATDNRVFLAIFPDVPSTLFLFFTILDIVELDHFFRTQRRTILIIFLVIIFQVVKEINHHVIGKGNGIWVSVWAGLFFFFIACYKRANLCYHGLTKKVYNFPNGCLNPHSKKAPNFLFPPALWRTKNQEENVNRLWTFADYSKLDSKKKKLKRKTIISL